MIQNGPLDNKDKKILELAKKNRDLQVKVETLKNKAARAMEQVNFLQNDDSLKKDPEVEIAEALEQSSDEVPALKKKLKESQKREMKIRAERDIIKTDMDKAYRVIEKEVGDGKSIEDILKDDSGWKGRAQKIDILKQKLNKAKQ